MDKKNSYLLNLLPASKSWEKDLEKKAEKERIPIIDKVSCHFLKQIIRIQKPNTILEIGTAIGYSALQMNDAYPEATIISIEQDQSRYHEAVQHIEKEKKTDQIQLIYGDALDELQKPYFQTMKFDFAFIDAAKGKYRQFFERIDPLLKDKGVIVSDNVLFKGYVYDHDRTPEQKRHIQLVKKIRSYNDWLVNHPSYTTTLVPIGDGLAVSYKEDLD